MLVAEQAHSHKGINECVSNILYQFICNLI